MKKKYLLPLILFEVLAYGQVGINTPDPKATFDITSKNTNGSTAEGILPPRLTGNSLHNASILGVYGAAQNGVIVYVTEPADDANQIGQTIKVDAYGFYFYDATQNQWKKLGSSSNIYNSDGTLSNTRHVIMDGNNLGFTGGRIGMGTSAPDPSAILDLTSTHDGFLPPRMLEAEMNNIVHPAHGLVIFCSDCFDDLGCLMVNDSKDPVVPNWGSLCSSNVPTGHITTLECTTATISGAVHSGVSASGVNATVPYTGGNGGTYPSASFNSTGGVTGLSANLIGGTLFEGNSNFVFTITGIPSGAGTANFPITVAGKSCTFTVEVDDFTASITSLTCGSAIFSPGTINQGQVYTGTLMIPYTGGNGEPYPQQSFTRNGLTFTLLAGTLATGNGSLVYNVTGSATASGPMTIPISFGSISCNVSTTVSTETSLVMCGSSKAWKTHNEGADESFDPNFPIKQIHGNYYQWGRKASVATVDTPPSNIIGWDSTFAPNLSWNASGSELTPIKAPQDPCPSGYRVPTRTEWITLHNNSTLSRLGSFIDIDSNFGSALVYKCGAKQLMLPAAGYRDYSTGILNHRGYEGVYWSSTEDPNGRSYVITFDASQVYGVSFFDSDLRSDGNSVRCISE
ncbi:fibrobacter succinogenes major paralogous domain-containing protein [Chryseobacterium potabilaquae]|uniref:Uncharacterized protein n=1 Tax=Chryseobacterium potabilaquae TaxID=2675057 RepID=A0A6N4XDF1_9FLAO|nr:FISUMP domain-containing protein [Chryseobacterium potabilaquae]CAA7196604.1 hypothetical protein CHRY9293_02684 [Chryseobacterium potabilaquae]